MATLLAEAARKERAIVEYAKDVICSIDAERRFISVSPASLSVWDYPPEDLIGRKLEEIVIADDASKTVQAIDDIKNGKSAVPFENQILRRDSSSVFTLWSVRWSDAENAFFCVAHDITERKEIERIKQEFVGIVSHDLRSPLTSVQLSLNLLSAGARGNLPEAAHKDLQSAERNVKRLINMINDLLDVEKMESGKWEMQYQRVSVASILDRAVESVRSLADEKGANLEVSTTDCQLVADEDRLVQVVVNLLSNAIKFSQTGKSVYLVAEEFGRWVDFRIRDEGPGIPAESREKIFDRFQQAAAGASAKKGGTGLGLAICSAIVKEHKGAIGVDSEEGKGSTFWFRIPLLQGVN